MTFRRAAILWQVAMQKLPLYCCNYIPPRLGNSGIIQKQYAMACGCTYSVLAGYDPTQVILMKEQCLLVDEQDKYVGTASKKDSHLLTNINSGMLHRAFSVFMFNSQGELLLQQRSHAKITYPDHWTNTCCSHPLDIPGEREEANAKGVKRAAQRKLQHELGIDPEQIPLKDFHFLTRIHYKSDNIPRDGIFGEHEIDYVLFIQRDVNLEPNENEVQDYRYVNKAQLECLMGESEQLITPWFQLIVRHFLSQWWDNLHNLSTQEDQTTIHHMIDSSCPNTDV